MISKAEKEIISKMGKDKLIIKNQHLLVEYVELYSIKDAGFSIYNEDKRDDLQNKIESFISISEKYILDSERYVENEIIFIIYMINRLKLSPEKTNEI